MRLSKEEFVKYVNEAQKIYDNVRKFEKAMELGPESTFNDAFNSFYNFLSDMCEFDEVKEVFDFGTYLDFYCFELNFGRKYKPGMIKDADGKEIDYSKPENVYDDIMGLKRDIGNCDDVNGEENNEED